MVVEGFWGLLKATEPNLQKMSSNGTNITVEQTQRPIRKRARYTKKAERVNAKPLASKRPLGPRLKSQTEQQRLPLQTALTHYTTLHHMPYTVAHTKPMCLSVCLADWLTQFGAPFGDATRMATLILWLGLGPLYFLAVCVSRRL